MRHIGPFEQHVREAIAVNRARARQYAAMTCGLSNRVFRRYLFAERLVLPFAALFDRRAAPYEEAGVPLLSSIFESMHRIPDVTGALEPRTDDAWSPHSAQMAGELKSAFQTRGFSGLAEVANDCLELLTPRPWRDCMLRHQIESIRRVAHVSPINLRHATNVGMPSPERLIHRFILFNLQGVRAAPWVDKPALQLQMLGFAILANDLPHIPPWPAGDLWSAESAVC